MAKLNWRNIEKEDYHHILIHWWNDWGWEEAPSLDMLPQLNALVYDEESGIPLYAGFLYDTQTSIGWVEWVISNKRTETSSKRGALRYLIDVLSSMAVQRGMRLLFSSTIEPSFVNSLKKTGFEIADKNVTQMMKII